MDREKSFLKNLVIIGVGSFIPKLSVFITLPILTEFLNKSEYGTYDLIISVALFMSPICTVQIQASAFRFLIDRRKDYTQQQIIISNISAFVIPAAFFGGVIVFCFFGDVNYTLRILIVFYFLLGVYRDSLSQISRGLGKNNYYSYSALISATVCIYGVFLRIYIYRGDLSDLLKVLVFSELAVIIYLVVMMKIGKLFSLKYIKLSEIINMLRYSWAFVPNNVSLWVLQLSDRIVITETYGVETNAVYAVANKIPSILSIGQAALAMAWQENASLSAKDSDRTEYYSGMHEKTFDVVVGMTCVVISFSSILFRILISDKYVVAFYQVPILILAMCFFVMSAFFSGIYVAYKRTVNMGVSTVVAAIINLLLDISLIHSLGIWAASISTLVAYAVLYYYRLINVQKFQKINLNIGRHFILLGCLTVFIVAQYVQGTNIILLILNILLSIVFFFIINRGLISEIIIAIKSKYYINKD